MHLWSPQSSRLAIMYTHFLSLPMGRGLPGAQEMKFIMEPSVHLKRPSLSEVCRPIHQCCSWPRENFCRLCPRKSSSAWLCTETSSAWNHVQMRCACAHVEWCSKNLYSASWKRNHSRRPCGLTSGSRTSVPRGILQIQSSCVSHCIATHCREARSSTVQPRMSSSSCRLRSKLW